LPDELADAANRRFWLLDLDCLQAQPVECFDYHAGGFSATRIDGQAFVLVPSADYQSTSVYALSLDGSAKQLWTVSGWSTDLLKVR
jgi:hypothetical protein